MQCNLQMLVSICGYICPAHPMIVKPSLQLVLELRMGPDPIRE